MKTITLQGTDEQFNNLSIAISHHSMPKEVETRVYVVDIHSLHSTPHWEVLEELFISLAEEQGMVYTLEGFQKDFNIGKFDDPYYVIRFINKPIY